jgi:hypothetical protein
MFHMGQTIFREAQDVGLPGNALHSGQREVNKTVEPAIELI